MQRVHGSGGDGDRVAVLLSAATRGRVRGGIDREAEGLDRRGLRVPRPEGDRLDLVAAAEVAQRGGLHLVDRRLVGRRVGRDLLLAVLREVRVAVALEVVGQADPRVRHDRGAAARLDGVGGAAVAAGAVELVAVERVVTRELVAHLVGHVVDCVEVAGRRRNPGAAAGLVRAADDAEVRHTAAGLPEGEVADVVVRRADDLADHEAGSRGAGAAGDLRLREARRRSAGAVGRSRRSPRVQVQQVVVRDQLHADREVVLVDLVDAIHQRDLRRGHVRRPAVVSGVAGIGDQREAVRAEDVSGRWVARGGIGLPVGALIALGLALGEVVSALELPSVVADVGAHVGRSGSG
jgi:hypothetical protein